MDNWSLMIMDTSIYTDAIPVTCPTLQILPPGFKKAITFDNTTIPTVAPNFILKFSACLLGLQKKDCGMYFDPLPDGVYVIKYSVSPHDIVYVEYNYLNITNALIQWESLLCDLELQACANPKDKEDRSKALYDIYMKLLAAKNAVQVCGNVTRGTELLNYAVNLMNKMTCKNC